jgi:uncharacterized tellurite resistance protein B-like protein
MLKAIARLFEPTEALPEEDDERRLHLAAAVLLFEVAKSDHQVEPRELQRLEAVLREQWQLHAQELAELMEVASRESDLSASLHQQVDTVNRNFSPAQKYDLLLGLWQVACSDGGIHHFEEHLVRRLADLLYLPHSEFIRAKHQALGEA